MKRLSLLLFVLAGFVFVSSFAAIAEEKKGSGAEPKWIERCNDKMKEERTKRGRCEIFQRLVEKKSQKRFVEAVISYPKEKKSARGVFILPLGILLQPGLIMKVDDGKAFKFQVRFCEPGGCFAYVDLNEDVLQSMRTGKKLVLNFESADQRKMNIELDLQGFGEALKKVS